MNFRPVIFGMIVVGLLTVWMFYAGFFMHGD